jgi:hypothetical protein
VPVRETSRTGGKTTGIFINGSAKTLLIGLAGAGLSAHKEIPFVVRCAPAEYQSAFLQALFEGDGGITGGKKARNGSTRYRLAYCTISEQLAYQVKAMLENFGIACKFKQRDTCWATNGTSKQVQKPAYGVKIEHTGAKAFKEFIGFAATRKQALLEDYVEHLYSAKLQNTNLDAHGLENKMPGREIFVHLVQHTDELLSHFEYDVAFGSQSRTCSLSLQCAYRDFGRRIDRIIARGYLTKYNVSTFNAVIGSFAKLS